jgi:hypothetical protein
MIRRHSRGQAIVETLAVLPLAVAVYFGVVLLARLHDLEARTITNARYAAFLQADSPPARRGAALDGMAVARTWSPGRTPMRADDAWNDRVFEGGYSANWRAPNEASRLVESADRIAVYTANGSLGGVPGGTLDSALAATRAVGLLGRGRLDLENAHLLTSTATVQLSPIDTLPAPLDGLDLVLSDRLAVLADPWSAAGPRHVVSRVQSLMPTSGIGRLLDLLTPVQLFVSIFEPEFRNLCVGHVDPEELPPDRIGPPTTLPRTSWRPACRP